MRDQFRGLASALQPLYPALSDAVKIDEGHIGHIKYRVYTPKTSDEGDIYPIGLYFHGGGLVIGPSFSDDVLCSTIAENTRSIVLAIQYRLSPEHKAPSHLEDTVKAVEWLHENAAQLRGSKDKIYLIGSSAGASLAVATARKVVSQKTRVEPSTLKGVIAFCPFAVHPDNIPRVSRTMHTSYEEFGESSAIINRASMVRFFEEAGVGADDDEYFVPLKLKHHDLFPPTYVAICECDPLRDDGKVLLESLQASGVITKSELYRGLPHCFWMFPSLPESATFMKNAIEGVNWVMSQM